MLRNFNLYFLLVGVVRVNVRQSTIIDVIQADRALSCFITIFRGLTDLQARFRFACLPKSTYWFNVHVSDICIYLVITFAIFRFTTNFMKKRSHVLVSWLAKNFREVV